MARDMEKKGLEGGIRRKKVLTGMPSLVKAAERQREQREVSVTPCHTRQRTVDSSEGHRAARTGKRFFVRLKQSPGSSDRASCPGRLMQSSNQAEQWGSTEPFLTWPGSGRGGEKGHHTNTDNRERGWARQRDPTGSWWEGQHG